MTDINDIQTAEMTYDEAVQELETIVKQMQSNECGVDKLKDYAARSVVLLGICKDKLGNIDQELQKLMDEID